MHEHIYRGRSVWDQALCMHLDEDHCHVDLGAVQRVLVHNPTDPEVDEEHASLHHGDGPPTQRLMQQAFHLGDREHLHAALTGQGARTWWDQRCLEAGKSWEEGFCDGLVQSRVFVCLVSPAAFLGLEKLKGNSACDNVLLEHRLALELRERGLITRVVTVFVSGGEAEWTALRKKVVTHTTHTTHTHTHTKRATHTTCNTQHKTRAHQHMST